MGHWYQNERKNCGTLISKKLGCPMLIILRVARFLDHMCLALRASGLWLCYATLQNLIPSFPWIAPPRPPPQRNSRKGRDQILPSGNTGAAGLSTRSRERWVVTVLQVLRRMFGVEKKVDSSLWRDGFALIIWVLFRFTICSVGVKESGSFSHYLIWSVLSQRGNCRILWQQFEFDIFDWNCLSGKLKIKT